MKFEEKIDRAITPQVDIMKILALIVEGIDTIDMMAEVGILERLMDNLYAITVAELAM
jgi:hypothetical protein